MKPQPTALEMVETRRKFSNDLPVEDSPKMPP